MYMHIDQAINDEGWGWHDMKFQRLSCPPSSQDNCGGLDGGDWELVRHVQAGNSWHPAKDQLRGTEAYGTSNGPLADHAWSKKFDATPFTEFLFATGDCEHWLIATKASVIGWYSNGQRPILKSSKNENAHTAAWYRRSGNVEDPWISTIDHGPAIGAGEIVYGENNFGGGHASNVLPQHKGANVYIRNKVMEGTWFKGENGESCDAVCSKVGRSCDSAAQTALNTNDLVAAAFKEAGYECKSFHGPRDYSGTPFSTARAGDDCAPFISGSSKQSTCAEAGPGHHSAICRCTK
jgi:hypothetical protein